MMKRGHEPATWFLSRYSYHFWLPDVGLRFDGSTKLAFKPIADLGLLKALPVTNHISAKLEHRQSLSSSTHLSKPGQRQGLEAFTMHCYHY